MTEISQGVLFYTQEDIDNKVLEVQAESNRRVFQELALHNDKVSNSIVEVLKGEVREGNMEKDYANALYGAFVDNVGLVAKTITTTYDVTVYSFGNEVCTFHGVEADSEEEACDLVESDISLDDVEVNFSLEFNGDTNYGSVSMSSWDFDAELTFEAVEA